MSKNTEEANIEEALAAALKGQPTLSVEEFTEKYEDKLARAYSERVNEAMLNNNLNDIDIFETYIEMMYVTYLEDYISDFYEEKFEEEDAEDEDITESGPYSGLDAVE